MEKNCVVLVTGASRGIGRGIALELARAGIVPAVHYKGNRHEAETTAGECSELLSRAGAHASLLPVFQANLSVSDDRVRLTDEVLAQWGHLDGLVNNAGIAPSQRDDILSADEKIFDEVLAVNLKGPYFLTQRIARHWIETPSKTPRRIVFITSVSAEMASVNRGEYCVSKAGLGMAVRLFSARLAPLGIPVVELRPGIILTDMTAGVKAAYDDRIADGLVPQCRWGEPEDIAKAVRGVMTGDLDFATGSVIHLDGGLHVPQL